MVDLKVNNNFKLGRKLGSGIFGEVFQGIDLQNNQEIAIKFEDINAKYPRLLYEFKFYQYLLRDSTSVDRGIPRVHYCTTEDKHNIMAMDLLGPSLENLFNLCNRKFTLKTVLMLGEQMLSTIEFIHSKSILHRDINPGNFVVGTAKEQHEVYLIDFGLAKRYQDSEGKHIEYKVGKSLVGSRYASVNTFLGIE